MKEKVGCWCGQQESATQERGLMADVRCAKLPEKFIKINLDTSQQGRVPNIEDHFGCLPHHLYVPLQWMNECLNKEDNKNLR